MPIFNRKGPQTSSQPKVYKESHRPQTPQPNKTANKALSSLFSMNDNNKSKPNMTST